MPAKVASKKGEKKDQRSMADEEGTGPKAEVPGSVLDSTDSNAGQAPDGTRQTAGERSMDGPPQSQ